MQNPARTSTAGTSYSAAQVLAQMVIPTATIRFRFDRLSYAGAFLGDLTPNVDWSVPPVISHDTTAAVKRSLTLQLVGNVTLNPLQDLIRPHCQLLMPDGGWVDFSLGTFTLLIPSKQITPGPTVRGINGADLGQLLVDAAFINSFGIAAGVDYLDAINVVISTAGLATPLLSAPFGSLIPDPGKSLPAALSWVQGDSRLKAITDLLTALNYLPPWWDENGVLNSAPFPDYSRARPSYTFNTTTVSPVVSPIVENPDTSQAYNTYLVIVDDPRRTPFSATYVNSNPLSPISTVNWHPKIAPPISDSSIPDLATAQARATTAAQLSARIYDVFQVATIPWPLSQDSDVYGLIYKSTDEGVVSQLYVETGWEFTCHPGAPTIHTLTRIVPA